MSEQSINTWLDKNFWHVVYLPLLTIAILLLLRGCGHCPQPIIVKDESKVTRDTADKEIKHDPVVVSGTGVITPRPRRNVAVRTAINPVGTPILPMDSNVIADNSMPLAMVDSLEPFTASLDSIVGKDTVSVQYDYPENKFRVAFKRAADTVQVVNTTIETTHFVQPEWYEKPSFTVPATAVTILAIFFAVR